MSRPVREQLLRWNPHRQTTSAITTTTTPDICIFVFSTLAVFVPRGKQSTVFDFESAEVVDLFILTRFVLFGVL